MRESGRRLLLASLALSIVPEACTLIAKPDRKRIPSDELAAAGEGGAGDGQAGAAGNEGGGSAGRATGGRAGSGSSSAGEAGAAGESGAGSGGGSSGPTCNRAHGTITLEPMTFFDDGDTFRIGDGVNQNIVFELDLASKLGVAPGHTAILFDGFEDNFELARLIATAINAEWGHFFVVAKTDGVTPPRLGSAGSGSAGFAGFAGSASAGFAGSSGSGGRAGAASGGRGGAAAAGRGGKASSDDTGGEGGAGEQGPAVIHLDNTLAGARGNLRISETMGNPHFQVWGMTGGEALACPSPTACDSASNCASGACPTSHVCN